MKILLGDKNRLALECVESYGDPSLGRIYMYVNGNRFGNDDIEFEIDSMIQNTLSHFKVYGQSLHGLADCPSVELFDSYVKVSSFDFENDDRERLGEISALNYMPGFVEKIVEVDDCVFRYVHYAFDNCLIILIPMGVKLKLYVRDDNSGFCTEVVTNEDEFLGLWKEMSRRRGLEEPN